MEILNIGPGSNEMNAMLLPKRLGRNLLKGLIGEESWNDGVNECQS